MPCTYIRLSKLSLIRDDVRISFIKLNLENIIYLYENSYIKNLLIGIIKLKSDQSFVTISAFSSESLNKGDFFCLRILINNIPT